jgi:hypothetical protein
VGEEKEVREKGRGGEREGDRGEEREQEMDNGQASSSSSSASSSFSSSASASASSASSEPGLAAQRADSENVLTAVYTKGEGSGAGGVDVGPAGGVSVLNVSEELNMTDIVGGGGGGGRGGGGEGKGGGGSGKDGKHGKTYGVGSRVPLGTNFTMRVELSSARQGPFLSGNFSVVFRVLDASLMPMVSRRESGVNNTRPFFFHYHLRQDAVLPAGRLHLVVEVIDDASGLVLTRRMVWYTLAIRMAATHLFIDKQEALLGDTISVRMIPGLLSDAGVFRAFPGNTSSRSILFAIMGLF